VSTETATLNVQVGRMNGRKPNPDQNFAWPGHRLRDLLPTENLGRLARPLENKCLHDLIKNLWREA
jgi:hypothetical protein